MQDIQNPLPRNPSFIGIGAQKAGTSWLYQKLIKHPQVWMAPEKEFHFFDRSPRYPSPNYLATPSPFARLLGLKSWESPRTIKYSLRIAQRLMQNDLQKALWYFKWTFGYYDENWYASLFSQAKPNQITGEITPSYSILEGEDIARISAVNPETKLIFLVRNPIDRAWSQVRFHNGKRLQASEKQLTSTNEIISFLKSDSMILRNDYERTLDNYLTYFDSSQILIGFYDAIRDNQTGLLSSIADFLGINPFDEKVLEKKIRVNVSPSSPMPKEVEDYLLETYSPLIERLANYLGSYATRWYDELGKESNSSSPSYQKTLFSPVVHL